MSIAERNQTQQEKVPQRYMHHYVETQDPFLADPETVRRINARLDELTAMGYYDDTSIDLSRARKGTIDRQNPSTKALIQELPTFSDWLDLVPTAAALDSLYDPSKETFASGKPMSVELGNWLRSIDDGRGIRSRAELVRNIMTQEALALDRPAQWLSLASGAAQPIIGTTQKIIDQGYDGPSVTLVDRDKNSLALARQYAESAGVGEQVQTRQMNVLRRRGLHRLDVRDWPVIASDIGAERTSLRGLAGALGRSRLPAQMYDTVEAVGLVEYLRPQDWTYTYKGVVDKERSNPVEMKLPMAGAKTFLKNAYELVRPGGSLVVGNMLDTHPQLGFTLNVIQWPHIQPRSIDDMMDIFDQAGLSTARDVYTAQDGVYAIYKITKES